uniref:G protein-coupled receptor n=1 Tax=Caenorhabditis tropicalis TaxID=1561998 RepID=A0A1I7SY82_9PELO
MNETDLCPEGYLLSINVLSITLSLPMVVVFLMLCVLLVIHSKTFHPFFTLSFILLIFSYAICNLCVLLLAIFQLYDESSLFIFYIDKLYLWVYLYIQPCVVIGLIERLCATIFVSSYEHSRFWIVYLAGQGLGIGVVYYETVLIDNEEFSDTAKNVQLGLSICICACLVVLFFINRHLTFNSRHRSRLTVRYQLAENVKALRTFVPFVVVDNCISILFVFSMIFFQVDFSINLEACKEIPGYKISFAVFRTILLLTQLFMPFLVVKQHSSIWNQVKSLLARRKPTVRQAKDTDQNKINNVLGMDIAGTNIDYFTQLKVQWLT